MAVSKRVRYEVLRRDNNTCRYCHATDSPLTVDHVTPVALGGSDDPSNLVAACRDCNAGKSSASPDSSLVAEVREDALRHAEMIRQAYAVVVERMGQRDSYIEDAMDEYTYTPLPADYRHSVGRWFEMGVPLEIVTDAVRIACSSPRAFYDEGRFKYMCGIVWNQVSAVTEAVELKAALDGAFLTEDQRLDENYEAHLDGRRSGWGTGYQAATKEFVVNDMYHRALRMHVDKQQTYSVVEDPFPGHPKISEMQEVGF